MLPTFQDRDYLITDKLSYRFSDPKRGDVIIANVKSEDKLIIKRVIATPGDTIKFVSPTSENEYIPAFYLNGKELKEPYINESMIINNDFEYTVKENEVFVMGDNRNNSADSRYYGPFSNNDIEGKVVLEIKDTLQFHTDSTKYIVIFVIIFLILVSYIFYPTKDSSKDKIDQL